MEPNKNKINDITILSLAHTFAVYFNTRSKSWKLTFMSIFSILLVAIVYVFFSGDDNAPKITYCNVKRADLKVTLPMHGIIEAKEKVDIAALFDGIIEYLRPEGDFVKKGEVIARLQTEDIKSDLESSQLSKRQVEIDYKISQIDDELKLFEKTNRRFYAYRTMKKDEIQYNQMKYGLDYTKKIEYEYQINNAEIDINNLENEIKEKEVLKNKGFVSAEEINDLKAQLYAKRKTREITKLNLEKLLKGIDIKQLADKETEISTDKLDLNYAKQAYEVFLTGKKVTKRGILRRLDNFSKEVSYKQQMLDDAEIKAPMDGIVIYGKTWITEGQQEKVKEGINVFEGWPFMSVSSVNEMNIVFKVNEVDVAKLKNGMAVDFTLSADPAVKHSGEIIGIDNVAKTSKKDANSISNIKVKARIKDKIPEVKPGMTVNAEIILGESKNTLVVPRQAVIDGCLRMKNGEKVKVETGLVSIAMVEIKSGANENDIVIDSIIEPGAASGIKSAGAAQKSSEYKVKKGDMADFIKDIGELAPLNKANVSVPFSGKINKIADEGTFVEKDYEIAIIDVKEREDKLAETELKLKVLEKDKKLIKEKAQSEIKNLENSIEVKKMDKNIALIEYEILIMPMKKYDRKDFEIAIKLAQNALKGIENEYKSKEEMAKKGYVSQNELSKIKLRLNNAQADLAVAKYKYDYQKSLPTNNNVEKAKIEIETKNLDYDLTVSKLENRKNKLKCEIEKNDIEHKFNNTQITKIKKIINQANVKAPASGTIIYVSRWSNEGMKKIKEGDKTHGNMTFMEVANLDKFYIKGSIAEEQFRQIKKSQPVEFYLPAMPEKRYKGKIKNISLFAREKEEANFSFASDPEAAELVESLRYFDIEIETDEKNPRFQPGISVIFEIVLDTKKNVLKIPRKYLLKDETTGENYVTMSGGARRIVKTGILNVDEVEICEGLNEGDSIVVY